MCSKRRILLNTMSHAVSFRQCGLALSQIFVGQSDDPSCVGLWCFHFAIRRATLRTG